MNFRPLHDRVVIRRPDAEAKTTGGIVIPDTAQEKPMLGEVIANGSADSGWMLELGVQADGSISGQITARPGYDALVLFDCT